MDGAGAPLQLVAVVGVLSSVHDSMYPPVAPPPPLKPPRMPLLPPLKSFAGRVLPEMPVSHSVLVGAPLPRRRVPSKRLHFSKGTAGGPPLQPPSCPGKTRLPSPISCIDRALVLAASEVAIKAILTLRQPVRRALPHPHGMHATGMVDTHVATSKPSSPHPCPAAPIAQNM